MVKALWHNPHVELELEEPSALKLPSDLARRTLPAQSAPVDGKALLAKTTLPTRRDKQWEIELAPLTRLQAWKVAESDLAQTCRLSASRSPGKKASLSLGQSIFLWMARHTACGPARFKAFGK